MKLICINKSPTAAITINKKYTTKSNIYSYMPLDSESHTYQFYNIKTKVFDKFYHILDDNNVECYYLVSCFMTLEEHRNNKLTEILL